MTKQIGNTDLIDTWASEGNIVDPDLSKKEEGWLLGEQPPHEWMNHIQNEHGQKINRLLDDTYDEETGLNRRVIYVDTVADLKALEGVKIGQFVVTKGYYSAGDGGSNKYEIVDAGSGTDDGGSFIDLISEDLQAKGLFGAKGFNAIQFGADPSGSLDSTTPIENMFKFGGADSTYIFPSGSEFSIKNVSCFNLSRCAVFAYGCKFVITEDGDQESPVYGFILNPDASPSSPESTAKSYIFWYGGEVTSSISDPVGVAAFQAYAIRQLTMRDTILGNATVNRLSSGIYLAGLGAHLFEKNRFLRVGIGFDCPDWSEGNTGAGIPISTSSFFNNEFILQDGQKAFYVRGGANRWKIWGGFSNGSEDTPVFHFKNDLAVQQVSFKGMGLEQLKKDGKYIYFEDSNTAGSRVSNISLEDMNLTGNPSSGGAVGLHIERGSYISVKSSRFEQAQNNNNWSMVFGPDCEEVQVAKSVALPVRVASGSAVNLEMTRRFLSDESNDANLRRVVIEEELYSTGDVNLNMSDLLGGDFKQIPPAGYYLTLVARDSGSSSSDNRRVEIYRPGTPVQARNIVSLDNVPDNQRRSISVFVPADDSGDLAMSVFASGEDTMQITLVVQKASG